MEYAALMARHMFNTVLNQFSEVAYDSIVPVPLHSARLRERGFNQSRELARHLSEFSGVPVASALVRTRPTPSQTRLNRRERARNIAGAFDVAKTANPLNHCLVVDDVYTTGATLNECAGVLRNAGATSIHCIAFARAIL
ncbi:MAG: ComF family protein [Candidatus Sumerlaeaceae bacterium]